MTTLDGFIYGILVGYILHPIVVLLVAIVRNAWRASGCGGDCNQGRKPCECRGKDNGIS